MGRRLYNCTNTETQALRSAGLVNVPIKIGKLQVKPGMSEPVPDHWMSPPEADRYFRVGALHLGVMPPAGFKEAKRPAPQPPPPALEPEPEPEESSEDGEDFQEESKPHQPKRTKRRGR